VPALWDGWNLLSETGSVGAVYICEPQQYGKLLAQNSSPARYYHYDGLGSTDRLTDSTETVTDSYAYSAYGQQLLTAGPTANPFQFVGRLGYYGDALTGLDYVRARYYGPSVARWISRDPLQLPADDSYLYGYVNNRPVNRKDPSGMQVVIPRSPPIPPDLPPGWAFDPITGQPIPPEGWKWNPITRTPQGPEDWIEIDGTWVPPPPCQVAVHCWPVRRSKSAITMTLGKHCGLTIKDNKGTTQIDGSGNSPQTIEKGWDPVAGQYLHQTYAGYPSTVCECLRTYISTFNNAKIPRDLFEGNSNWALHCMATECKVDITWSFGESPTGYYGKGACIRSHTEIVMVNVDPVPMCVEICDERATCPKTTVKPY
jgi:RHS repeat-associated protein